MVSFDVNVRIKAECTVTGHVSLRLANMFLVKQKLTIQIAHIDGVQIDLFRMVFVGDYNYYYQRGGDNLRFQCQQIRRERDF